MASEFNPNQNYQYQKFPSFRNIGRNQQGIINVHPPNNVLGEKQELAVVVGKPNEFRFQKKCNRYPSSGVVSIKNERSRIDEINKLKPIKGDMIWAINPEYTKDTFYSYFGFTHLQISLILDYEADVCRFYLKELFRNQNTLNKLFHPIPNIINYKFAGGLMAIRKAEGRDLKDVIDIFIEFCIDFKIIDKRINEIINKSENWDDLKIYFGDKTEEWNDFFDELSKIHFKLFSCFSFHHIMKRINFLGVCEVIEEQKNDYEIHFFRVRYQYYGEIDTYLLAPNMKKHAQCNCYWYRTKKTKPLKQLIYKSYTNLDLLKKRMFVEDDEEEEKEEKEIVIKRGVFIGQIKDSKRVRYYSKNMYFLMQKFPLKSLREDIKVKTSDEIWDLIHDKQERRKLTLNVYY